MTIAILVLLLVVVCELYFVISRLGDCLQYCRETQTKLNDVSKQVHTRQSVVSVQSGPVTQEQQLARLGRHSVGRRVVVGGDEDSQLHQNLTTRTAVNQDG